MTRTTPRRPVDVEAMVPALAAHRRVTTRLHPRRGEPGPDDSSMGGPLLWPASEPWPTCTGPHADLGRGVAGPQPMVAVLQLFAADVPDLPFPDGTDLLQVVWCPTDHEPRYCPRPELRWRSAEAVRSGPLLDAAPPVASDAEDDHVPRPCVLHPERVVEHPSWDLPEDLAAIVYAREDELEALTGLHYQYHLSSAPGTKVGGYPGWTQDPDWPDCPTCGQRMGHLLTIASTEFDGEDHRTWLPVEDRLGDDVFDRPLAERLALQGPADLMLGDMGGVYLFVCTRCPDRPFDHRFDCS